MKRLLPVLAVFLAACSQAAGSERTFLLTINTEDATRRNEVLEASARVIDRRLQNLGESLLKSSSTATQDGVLLTVAARSEPVMDALAEQLVQPFTLAFMKEVEEKDADITIAGHGAYKATGFTEQDISWTAVETQTNGKFRVTIEFTADGRTKMEKLYKENPGKYIGMFVRGKLVSKLLVEETSLKDKIVISDIPTKEFADAFSDDVNVGRYVTFTPRP